MASTITAKIAPLPRGDYSSSATYDKLDVVSYNGSSYMAIKAVPTGTVPTNTTYWQLLVDNSVPDGAITTAKLADGAVTDAKLAQSGGVLDEVADLKSDLTNAVNATRDIADAVGVVFPYVVEAGGLDFHANSKPTVSTYRPDRRAHTSIDFPLQLPAGTKIIPAPYFRFGVMSTADGTTYSGSGWKTAEYTLPSDLTVYLTLASARGGEPDPIAPEVLANSYTIVLPNGKTGLLGDVAKLTQDLSDLNNSVNNISDDFSAYKNSIGNPLAQYLNASTWLVNYYWNGSLASTSANGYECIKAEGLKAGTYHFNRMSAPFTWFENLATGEVKRASTDYGLSDITTETEVTIDYDFSLYLTITGSHISYGVMVTDGDMPDSYLTTAQLYAFNLTEAFKTSVGKPIYCGSTREYTTLKSAIEEATKYMDSVVYVDAETFDLVNEFGSEWLENYSEEANCGLFLKNRVHVIFASGAKVVFNYTGSNEYIQRRFSPFNAGQYGFTLENAYVESTNCRYSVHDERGTNEDAYHNIYKRCTFIHDSTGTTWGSHQCIGGGLGKNGDVLIEDCYMQTAGTATNISYHNSAAVNAESRIVLKDSYLSNTCLISNYGTSTKKTRMMVTNCSLKNEPMISTEAQYADNVELIKWNNYIRP